MPFPVIAAIGIGISALGARDQIRRNQIAQNQARRERDRMFADMAASAKKQTIAEQDKQLPIQQSALSMPANSYSKNDVIEIAGAEVKTDTLIIGAVALIIGFILIKAI